MGRERLVLSVWTSRDRLRAEAMQRDHDVSMSSLGLQVTRLATAVAASNRSHSEGLEALSRRVEEMEASTNPNRNPNPKPNPKPLTRNPETLALALSLT